MSVDASAIPVRVGGVGRYVLNLVEALGHHDDVEVQIIARTGDRARWAEACPPASVHDAVPQSRPLRLLWEQARMPRLLRSMGVEVHHGPHYTMPARGPVPAVVTVHDMTFVDHPEWHERWKVSYFRRAIGAALRSAAVIVCVSQATADRLAAFGRAAGEVVVIPHGVDLVRFSPEGAGDEEALAGLGVRPPYVAFVGTVEPRKGVPDLVRAFESLAADNPDLTLVIGGLAGWGEQAVSEAIAGSAVGGRIVRLGYLEEMAVAPLLRRAAAVAYPSLEEGFGLPVLEALACGAPTVTTSGSSMEEFAGGAAWLVPPGDTDALAGAIGAIVTGDGAVAEHRAQGLEVAASYTWARSASAHVDAYRRAAGTAT